MNTMTPEEINNIKDSDKYWEESDRYIADRFNSEEGQKKLKEFQDAQKELLESVKNSLKRFSDSREDLKEYLGKGLKQVEDIFETEGIDSDNIYNEEALDLYVTLTF